MGRKVLQVIESAYRATLEEQDDTAVWLSGALQDAGADVAILLAGNAVCYLARGQDAAGLAFGARKQTNPPDVHADLEKLAVKGAEIFYVREDAIARGVDRRPLLERALPVSRERVPELFARYERVWRW